VDLSLDRFKAFEHTDLAIAPLTILIGPNNAGKSTILHALALLAQSVAANVSNVQTSGPLVDLGQNPRELTKADSEHHGRDGWGISLHWKHTLEADDPVAPGTEAGIQFEIRAGGYEVFERSAASVELQCPPPRRVRVSVASVSQEATIQADRYDGGGRNLAGFIEKYQQPSSGQIWRLGGSWDWDSRKVYTLGQVENENNAASREYPQRLASAFTSRGIPNALAACDYICATRQLASSTLPLGGAPPYQLTEPAEVATALAFDRDLRRRVARRCEALFQQSVDVITRRNHTVDVVGITDVDRAISAVNMGSGFNQVVWMAAVIERRLMLAESLPEPAVTPVITLDEPELHLHPTAQSRVAQLLVDYSSSGVRIVCTTHSEHVLTAVLRQVLAGRLAPSDIAVYYVEAGKADRLDVDERGRLAGGLRGFFEANEAELLDHLRLMAERERPDADRS
jgi:ABC-type Mn2+/Zn2+ transport system ATPase subunit